MADSVQQSHHDTVDEALFGDEFAKLLQASDVQGSFRIISGGQGGIHSLGGLVPSLADGQDKQDPFSPIAAAPATIAFCNRDVMGDEHQQGPSMNYAQLFTWSQVSRTLLLALETTMKNANKRYRVDGLHLSAISFAGESMQSSEQVTLADRDIDLFLEGDSYQAARYCGLQNGVLPAYASWRSIWAYPESRIFSFMALAAANALLIQWGTAGAAILIAYRTYVIGLGCRSGAYIIYGVLGTLGWLLHVLSMCLSHSAMLMYQDALQQDPQIVFAAPDPDKSKAQVRTRQIFEAGSRNGHNLSDLESNGMTQQQDVRVYHRTSLHSFICLLAILTRDLGKLIVALNALWIIISSLMEIINLYDNCWCNTNRNEHGWVLLFKSASELKATAQRTWGGGVALSMSTSLLGFLVFWLGGRRRT